jgi:hypothetical protein
MEAHTAQAEVLMVRGGPVQEATAGKKAMVARRAVVAGVGLVTAMVKMAMAVQRVAGATMLLLLLTEV